MDSPQPGLVDRFQRSRRKRQRLEQPVEHGIEQPRAGIAEAGCPQSLVHRRAMEAEQLTPPPSWYQLGCEPYRASRRQRIDNQPDRPLVTRQTIAEVLLTVLSVVPVDCRADRAGSFAGDQGEACRLHSRAVCRSRPRAGNAAAPGLGSQLPALADSRGGDDSFAVRFVASSTTHTGPHPHV
jgi:hypothetical protein